MQVVLKAKHFIGTVYGDGQNCAIAKALNEQYPTEFTWNVSVVLVHKFRKREFLNGPLREYAITGDRIMEGWGYRGLEFGLDARLAELAEDPETPIRTLELVLTDSPINKQPINNPIQHE